MTVSSEQSAVGSKTPKNKHAIKTAIVFTYLLLTAPLSALAGADQPKLIRIGWLGARSGAGPESGRELFRREFSKLGYVEGRDVVIESRYAESKLERLPALADELIRLRVDVLLAAATPEALAAKQATTSIPIVFFGAADPVAAGLVHSLARPGGNLTGFTNIASALTGKRLELLKETVPKLAHVAVLWDPKNGGSAEQWKEHQLAARQLGLQFQSLEVSHAGELEQAFKEIIRARGTALSGTSNPLFASNVHKIAELAARHRSPSIYPNNLYVSAGGLMSYGQDRTEPYRRAAVYVDRIIKGAKPADLPVEQPTKFELVINVKTAKQIGLTIPPNILARADTVIR